MWSLCVDRHKDNLHDEKDCTHRNGFKSPRLDELYKYAVGKTIQNHHNALGDVQSLHEAITSLLESGEFTLPL
jgi:hypothetical protein